MLGLPVTRVLMSINIFKWYSKNLLVDLNVCTPIHLSVLLQILQRCVRMDLQELYQKGFAPINLNEHLYEKSSPNKKGDPQFWTCWFPHRSKLINVTSCTSLMLTLHFLNPKWNYGQLSQVKSRSIVIIFGYSWVFHEPLHHMIIGRFSKGSLRISDPGLGQSRPGAAFHLALGDVAKSPVDRGFRNPQSHHSSWLSWTMKDELWKYHTSSVISLSVLAWHCVFIMTYHTILFYKTPKNTREHGTPPWLRSHWNSRLSRWRGAERLKIALLVERL